MSEHSDELIHTAENPIYHRLNDEGYSDYELFTEYCKIPPTARTLANMGRRTNVPSKIIRKLMEKWSWEVRANAFDHDSLQLRPDPRHMDDEAAIAGQLAASTMLIELGLSSLALKDPSLIPVDKALRLAEKGIEIQRKAHGMADMNVQFDVEDMTRVNRLIGEVVGAEDIEDVEEMPDVPEVNDPGVDPDLPI